MANLFDHIGQRAYESIFETNKRFEVFSYLDVWQYFIEVAKDDRRVVGCALKVEKKGNHYKISQFMLDKRSEPIVSKGDFILGHIWEAYDLDDDLYEVLQCGMIVTISLKTLKIRPKSTKIIEEDE